MISVEKLVSKLKKNNLDFFTGVPDSVLKNFSLFIKSYKKNKHMIAANEGGSIALAIGYYLSTKKVATVYMQNSGLSNAINPLISIAHKKVYSIPMLLIIGWRGAPGTPDEPQHKAKGTITKKILSLLGVKTIELKKNEDLKKLEEIIKYSKKEKKPVACLIRKNVLKLEKKIYFKSTYPKGLIRHEVLREILKIIKDKTNIISTTGYTSRELNQIRHEKKYNGKDFYMVGGMGHSSMVALSSSIFSKKKTICIDGDGSMLMHLGSMSLCNSYAKKNFKYILMNNNSHESVGGQTTNIKNINIKKLFEGFKFKKKFQIKKKKELSKKLKLFLNSNGPSFLEIKIRNETIKNLIRPKSLAFIKNQFMKE